MSLQLLDKLAEGGGLSHAEYVELLQARSPALAEELFARARHVRDRIYGPQVFLRGLVELSSYCRNDCYYCGLRRSNHNTERYRLTPEQILASCEVGYRLGFRTFDLQGGEDEYFTDERVVALVRSVKASCPGSAVTLSLGEKSYESYRRLREAGAERYLLRHETADPEHYRLHPKVHWRSVCVACTICVRSAIRPALASSSAPRRLIVWLRTWLSRHLPEMIDSHLCRIMTRRLRSAAGDLI